MVFAAVPDDITIEKITAAEKKALDEYLGRESRSTIFQRLAGNEKVPTLIAGTVLLVSAPTILKIIFDALAKQKLPTVNLPDGEVIKAAGIDYLTFTKDFAEAAFDFTGSGKAFGLFEGEADDFWSKYVKR